MYEFSFVTTDLPEFFGEKTPETLNRTFEGSIRSLAVFAPFESEQGGKKVPLLTNVGEFLAVRGAHGFAALNSDFSPGRGLITIYYTDPVNSQPEKRSNTATHNLL